jgi:diguanylate cyclase (GGDEF)-like protein
MTKGMQWRPHLPVLEDSFKRRISGRVLVAVVAVTIVGFSAICSRTLLEMRRADWKNARHASENMALTLTADIARNIEVYDLSLLAVANNLANPEVRNISKPLLHLVLFDHAATARHFGSIQVLDKTGHVAIDSASLDPEPSNMAAESYFLAHQSGVDTGLFISNPAMDRYGEYVIYLSRRINAADGSFGGVAVGSIKLKYFHDLFRRLTTNAEDSLTLINRSGIIIMRLPFDIDMIGKDLSSRNHMRRVLSGTTSGWFEGSGAVDNIQRLYVWPESASPLIVVQGRSLSQVYSAWWGEVVSILSAMAVFIALIVSMTVVLVKEMAKRSALEARLSNSARTDALTGLFNRRHFDETISMEWQRGSRQKTPLALLMIDADHFKSYNDMFGHQAGDGVLRRLASCISGALKRPTDCVARYGGEEFVVILPGLSAEQACKVAERVRKAVEDLPAYEAAVTVSVGVASLTPTAGGSYDELIAMADTALYAAKETGRNRCEVAHHDREFRMAS